MKWELVAKPIGSGIPKSEVRSIDGPDEGWQGSVLTYALPNDLARMFALSPRMTAVIRSALPVVQRMADVDMIHGQKDPSLMALGHELANIVKELDEVSR